MPYQADCGYIDTYFGVSPWLTSFPLTSNSFCALGKNSA